MALFDQNNRGLVVRVVYDGMGSAGKTSNLRELCQFFSERRRSDVFTPTELDGRTVVFDWLRLNAGLVLGYRLCCHLLTVPGQSGLSRRRAQILSWADAVVFVCDSTRAGVSRARPRFARLLAFACERNLPLIIQANKQDLDMAMSPEEVAAALGASDLPLIGTSATNATGIRETAVLAIRAAADRVEAQVRAHGVESLPNLTEGPEELADQVRGADRKGPNGSALQLVDDIPDDGIFSGLSEFNEDGAAGVGKAKSVSAGGPHVASESAVSGDADGDAGVRDGGAPPLTAASSESDPTAETRIGRDDEGTVVELEVDEADDEEFARALAAMAERHEPDAVPPPVGGEVQSLAFDRGGAESSTAGWPAPRRAVANRVGNGRPRPPWPHWDVSSGFIWPNRRGREVLMSLDIGRAQVRDDLFSQRGQGDGNARTDAIIIQVESWCLKTSARRRFRDSDEARAALARTVGAKLSLGPMLSPDTVLVITPDLDGGYWLWTIAPWWTTLRAQMNEASHRGDGVALRDALVQYADAALGAIALAAERGIVLDVHPSNFAVSNQKPVYLDDAIAMGTQLPAVGHSILVRVTEYAAAQGAVEAYLEHLEAGIVQRLTPREIAVVGLYESLINVSAAAPVTVRARERLLAAVLRASEIAEAQGEP